MPVGAARRLRPDGEPLPRRARLATPAPPARDRSRPGTGSASSLTGAPTWICPSITVPADRRRDQRDDYYVLMFLEAYANGGRWGYYWWPGVDVETRLAATAPEALKDHIRFIGAHRDLYEGTSSMNDLAILYADGPISCDAPRRITSTSRSRRRSPNRRTSSTSSTRGDGRFNPEELDPRGARAVPRRSWSRRRVTSASGPPPRSTSFARAGGELVVFSEHPLDPDAGPRSRRGHAARPSGSDYRDEDRDRIVERRRARVRADRVLRSGRRSSRGTRAATGRSSTCSTTATTRRPTP